MNSKACILFTCSWICVTLGILFQLCAGVMETSWWIFDSEASGIVCSTDAIRSAQVFSAISCGFACSKESNCTSFTYVNTAVGLNCYMMYRDPSLLANCDPEQDAKHYMMVHTAFTCLPLEDGNFFAHRLSNGDIFKFRIGRQVLDVPSARANCTSTGGFLVKLSTQAKIDFVHNLMTSCPTFRLYYHVGGSYDEVNAV